MNLAIEQVMSRTIVDEPSWSAPQVLSYLRDNFEESALPSLRTVQRAVANVRPHSWGNKWHRWQVAGMRIAGNNSYVVLACECGNARESFAYEFAPD